MIELISTTFNAILAGAKYLWESIVFVIWYKRWVGFTLMMITCFICLFLLARSILAR